MIASAAAAFGIPARTTYGAQVSVDEPQYLMTAISLGEDFDLDISDEIIEKRYLPFHEIDLNAQTIDLNNDGQRLSPHDPLLPALLALPMRLGGWVGARVALTILSGVLAAMTLWVAVRRFDVSTLTGAWVVGALSATPPLTAYGSQIYPEIPAAIAVVAAVGAATGLKATTDNRSLRVRETVILLLSLTALPWLSVKYTPTAAALAGIAGLSLWRDGQRRRLVTVGLVLTAMAAAYLVVHNQIYGGWTVYAAGDHFTDSEFGVVGFQPDYLGRSRRLVGLLVDRPFGLAAWSPAWLAIAPALGAIIGRRPQHWIILTAPLAAGWATATWVALTMHGWWWPGRQLVVVLPLAVILIAIAVDQARRTLAPLIVVAMVGTTGWIWLAVEASTGRRALAVDITETKWVGYRWFSQLLPDLHRGSTIDLWWATGWAIFLVGVIGYSAHKSKTDYRPTSPDSVQSNKDAGGGKSSHADKVSTNLDGSSPIR